MAFAVSLLGTSTDVTSSTGTVDLSLIGTLQDITTPQAPANASLSGKGTDVTSASGSMGLSIAGQSQDTSTGTTPLDLALSAYMQAITSAYATNTGPTPLYFTGLAQSITSAMATMGFTSAVAVWLPAPPNWQPWNVSATWQVLTWDNEVYQGNGLGIPPPLNTQVQVANVVVPNGALKVWIPSSQVLPLG